MKSVIEKLFYGRFSPIEAVRLSEEQRKCIKVAAECDGKLTELFRENAEALGVFERFKDAMEENFSDEALAYYKEGFRNGFQLALDATEGD